MGPHPIEWYSYWCPNYLNLEAEFWCFFRWILGHCYRSAWWFWMNRTTAVFFCGPLLVCAIKKKRCLNLGSRLHHPYVYMYMYIYIYILLWYYNIYIYNLWKKKTYDFRWRCSLQRNSGSRGPSCSGSTLRLPACLSPGPWGDEPSIKTRLFLWKLVAFPKEWLIIVNYA